MTSSWCPGLHKGWSGGELARTESQGGAVAGTQGVKESRAIRSGFQEPTRGPGVIFLADSHSLVWVGLLTPPLGK